MAATSSGKMAAETATKTKPSTTIGTNARLEKALAALGTPRRRMGPQSRGAQAAHRNGAA